MDKHLDILTELLIKHYNNEFNGYVVSWELADEELKSLIPTQYNFIIRLMILLLGCFIYVISWPNVALYGRCFRYCLYNLVNMFRCLFINILNDYICNG